MNTNQNDMEYLNSSKVKFFFFFLQNKNVQL